MSHLLPFYENYGSDSTTTSEKDGALDRMFYYDWLAATKQQALLLFVGPK